MWIPSSTYRVQLNDGFTLTDLESVLDYLHELGVSTIYASPISTATKGSTHGYDVTDPLRLNPDIGTEDQLQRLSTTLHGLGMSWLQDIVPNHMAYDAANPWMQDMLERGPDSPYYAYFDRLICDQAKNDRLMAPFLGSPPGDCIEKGEISLQFTQAGFVIRCYDKDYPVAARLYRRICPGTGVPPEEWLSALKELESAIATPPDTWKTAKDRWMRRVGANAAAKEHIANCIGYFNQHPPLLQSLMDGQHYELTEARLAATRINYRRFFTINGLICLCMEKEEVFHAWHQSLWRWHANGWINGLRVDHIDGLAAPKAYLQRLRSLFGADCYVVAEKILSREEAMPEEWPLHGTTGYDFLAAASQLLTDAEGSRRLLNFYCKEIIKLSDYKTIVYNRKLNFLYRYMGGELDCLLHMALVLAHELDPGRLKHALAVWMAAFPVYRAYPDEQGGAAADRSIFNQSLSDARDRRPDLAAELDFFAEVCNYDNSETGQRRLAFLTRLMQLTGPLAAKGIEDTTFYVYNPYISHCEVGDSPGVAGISGEAFHRRMRNRQEHWRHTLNATTTHDTKRGEDSRIRLSFLSAMPDEWIAAVTQWRQLNKAHAAPSGPAPSPNDEYLIYQSLLGGFPEDGIITDDFRQRFSAWLVKALREAKTETDYDDPNLAYEEHCQHFISTILTPGSPFLTHFTSFAMAVIGRSAIYCLSQLLLKLTAPGVPDIYQGADLYELSFVDPDNRRPVDYPLRHSLLRQIREAEAKSTEALFDLLRLHRQKGIDKLFILYRVLNVRQQFPHLFAEGDYIPVQCPGPFLTYLRHHDHDWALIAVPLFHDGPVDPRPATMTLPPGTPAHWKDGFSGAVIRIEQGNPLRPDLRADWPFLFLTATVPE
jgi:(1->4)-alpha-D-glucan 1-alpha-D-glucosylmutase